MKQTSWVRSLPNTAGEMERETKSRRFNVIEAFGVMTFVLVVLWFVQYPFGVLMKIKAAEAFSTILLILGALCILFISPWLIHRDTLASWGLGNPVALFRRLRDDKGTSRGPLALAIGVVVAGLTVAFYWQWTEAADFLFDMKLENAQAFKQTAGGKIAIGALGLVLAAFFGTCVIRYDNFGSAFLTALKLIAMLGVPLYLAAYAVMGTKAFSDFEASKFGLDVFGYVFWGAIQQLLFSSYFGTRLRRGFAPASARKHLAMRRFCVAVLNGSFFGLIHINSWLLVLACWILGACLSWVFMEDRNRNLVALGFIHGFLGSSIGWLFSNGKSQAVEIEMGVGPSHMHGFDLGTFLVVVPLVIGFSIFMARAARTWREDDRV